MDKNSSPKTAQKLSVTFSVEKGNNTYTFMMPYQCPLGEAYDAVYEVLSDIIQMSQRAFENAKQKGEMEASEKKSEGSK